MSQLSAADKKLLNDLSKSQPALNRAGEPNASSGIAIGDQLSLAMSAVSVKATYDFAALGGGISTDLGLGVFIPAGAIVTAAIAEWTTPPTSAGAATVDLKVGTILIVAALDPLSKSLGAIEALTVVPMKAASKLELKLDIDVAALTAGKVSFYVSYILP